jgi:uroporphyrinogen decarboxylase
MSKRELMPRERVRLALQHQETDRVPVDFFATAECWQRLLKYLGLPNEETALRYFGVDIRQPRLGYVGPPLRTLSDGSFIDAWGITWRPISYGTGVYYDVGVNPLADIKDAAQLADYPWPDPDWWDVTCMLDAINQWNSDTEYAITLPDFGDPGGFFEIATYMRGMEQILMDSALNPDIPFEIMRRITDVLIVLAERTLDVLGERVDLIWTSDDIAHQRGLLMSLPMLQELVFPHHKRFNDRVHELGGKIMYHSCGSVTKAIPDLLTMGIDVLDVLQFSAEDMVPEYLKATYGDRLCFHGGVDVQQLLPRADEDEVADTVTHIINVMARGGGYILSPSHAVQVDVPPANIVAVYRAAGSLLDEAPDEITAVTTGSFLGQVAQA